MIETLQELEDLYLEIKLEGKTKGGMIHIILSRELYDHINKSRLTVSWKEGHYSLLFNPKYKDVIFHVGD